MHDAGTGAVRLSDLGAEMTFEEWTAALLPFEARVLTRREIFQAGSASRDAEIKHLQMALADAEALELGTAEKCDQLRSELESVRAEIESTRSVTLKLCGAMGLNEKWSAESTKSILHACTNNYIEGLYLLRQGIRLLNGEK